MRENNRQYIAMYEAIIKKLDGASPEKLAEKTGFHWDGVKFKTETLGISIQISWPECHITPELEMWHDLTILQYMANTIGAIPIGNFISMSAFTEGGLARGTSFDRENDIIISRIGQKYVDNIRIAATKLGGTELSEKSDLTFMFSFLPRIPMKLCIWLPDEDFPATGKVLFDTSANRDLKVEAAGTAAGVMLTKLENCMNCLSTI